MPNDPQAPYDSGDWRLESTSVGRKAPSFTIEDDGVWLTDGGGRYTVHLGPFDQVAAAMADFLAAHDFEDRALPIVTMGEVQEHWEEKP